jgi:choline dehydrogenase
LASRWSAGIIAIVTGTIQREYDQVVVGAGTAGCIVAARLAEKGQRVLLLEAGGPYRRILDIPLIGLWAWLRNPSAYCWNEYTIPQAELGGRRIWFPGGRITGGGSAINAMIYTRGHAGSYDRWNVPGWHFEDLLSSHRRAEDYENGPSGFHGTGGPLAVSSCRNRYALAESFLQAGVEAGFELNDDFNGASSLGVGFYSLTQRRGVRSVPGKSYLQLARRYQGFHHETGVHVRQVMIEHGRVTGVVSEKAGETRSHHANQVILCAGTVRTPQLLMLSGIGAADDLRRLGIGVNADQPSVGESLQDQMRVPVAFHYKGASLLRPDRMVAAGLQYVFNQSGLLASNVCEAAAIACLSSGSVPDVRVAFRWRVFPETGIPMVDFEVATLQPQSRGRITLRSADPHDPPTIDPGYLTARADREALENGIALARRIATTNAMRQAGVAKEYAPGSTSLAEHVSQHAASAFHPVGTCRMGADDASVVDPQLCVRGVDGLRVIDASVIPSCVSANAQASVIALAERACELMLRDAGDR